MPKLKDQTYEPSHYTYIKISTHVFTYLYTLDDDSEHPVDYETSLFLSVLIGKYVFFLQKIMCLD